MSDGNKPLNLAMVGCGGYAGFLIERIFEVPESCRLVAVTTRRPESESAQKCKARGVDLYRDIDELFDAVTPDECPAIVIPTSIESHYEYTKKAVDAGFHVLLEKPPTATVQDVDRLIKLQRDSGKWIAVNFQYLFNPMTQRLKQQLAAGEFGRVLAVKASALWSRPETYFSRSSWSGKLMVDGQWVLDGTVGNPLAHLLAESLYLATPSAGMADPVCVEAELYHVNDIESEDTSCLRIETAEGVEVFYCATLCSEETKPVVCGIETEKADICLTDYFQLSIHWKDGRVEEAEMPGNDHNLYRRIMLEALSKSLRNNERPLITVEECRPYMLAWNGTFESAGIPIGNVPYDCVETEQGCMRVVRDIPELCQRAVEQNRLFSELDSTWESSCIPVDLRSYTKFPSVNPELISLIPADEETMMVEKVLIEPVFPAVSVITEKEPRR